MPKENAGKPFVSIWGNITKFRVWVRCLGFVKAAMRSSLKLAQGT